MNSAPSCITGSGELLALTPNAHISIYPRGPSGSTQPKSTIESQQASYIIVPSHWADREQMCRLLATP